MYKLKDYSKEKPLMFTLLLIMPLMMIMFANFSLSAVIFADESEIYRDMISSIVKNIMTIFLIVIIVKFNWLKKSLLTTSYKDWYGKWWLGALPITLIVCLSLSQVNWTILEFSISNLFSWIYLNFSTAIFEEVLMRGICFYVLYSAWKDQNNGLMKAAICQAVIFGLAHYGNLAKEPFMIVSLQVTFATLVGIGFAGILVYSRSLWPPIIIHFLINSAGSVSSYFQPDYVPAEMLINNYIMVIVLFTILCALPGYILLRKSAARISEQTSDKSLTI
jgi:membrane protease YdiL (CAAX protease family)